MRHQSALPPLWFFTDQTRQPDPLAVARRLPKGLCGIVLRDDHHPDRAVLGRELAKICRDRRHLLVVAGDAKLAFALQAGLHLRRGRPALGPRAALITSSAHNPAELRRARQAGAAAVFLSPLFATGSHPGAPALGVIRWLRLAGRDRATCLALGGIGSAALRRLPRSLRGIGAIDGFRMD